MHSNIEIQTHHVLWFDLDPVRIPSIKDILGVRVLDDQAFSTVFHDLFHPIPDVLGSFPLVLYR
jgi:hypothetical protein